MVLPDREDVKAELIGELDLLDQLAHPLLRTDARAEIGEGCDSEFHEPKRSRLLASASSLPLGQITQSPEDPLLEMVLTPFDGSLLETGICEDRAR